MLPEPGHPLVWGVVFITGAVIGSFLNVVIYRWPRAESIVAPPSHCGSCGARLRVPDLIPILSYVFLRGRCRHCGHSYSPRYAVVELVTGLMAVGALQQFGPTPAGLGAFVVCCSLLLAFFIDLDHMIIPDELVWVIALVGVGANVWALGHAGVTGVDGATRALGFTQQVGGSVRTLWLPASLVGLAVGGGAFWLISAGFERLMGKPVMGFGDVKLAAAMGALLGPGYGFIAWFLISIVIGALVSVALLTLRVRRRGDYIPFGPMLAVGGAIVVLYPDAAGAVLRLYGG
jgi:leader peptidase (prepilin peptidase)/N-methyltransferase